MLDLITATNVVPINHIILIEIFGILKVGQIKEKRKKNDLKFEVILLNKYSIFGGPWFFLHFENNTLLLDCS